MIFHRTRFSRGLCPRDRVRGGEDPPNFSGGHDMPRIHSRPAASDRERTAQQGAPGRGSTTAGSRGRSAQGKPVRAAQQARSWLRLAAHKESRSRPGPGESSNDEDRTSIKPRKGAGCFFDKRVGRPSELQRLFKLWCPLVTFGVSKNRGCLHRVSTL